MIDGIEIIEEMGNIYLCIEDRVSSDNEYMCQMLENNRISGLLKMNRGFKGTDKVLKYNVSNMRSLTDEYAHRVIGAEELESLLGKMTQIRQEANAYLLDEHMLCLDPDYIYISMEDKGNRLLFLPFDIPSAKGRFYPLADFFLAKVDSHDEAAVKLAYDFYRLSREQLFSLESFLKYILGNKSKESGERLAAGRIEQPAVEDTSYSILQEDKSITPQYAGDEAPKDNSKKQRRSLLAILRGRRKEEEQAIYNAFHATVDDYWGPSESAAEDDDVTQYYQVTATDAIKIIYLQGTREKSQIFTAGPIIIGKKREEVNLCIDDTSVSRKHARIEAKNGSIIIEDMYSKNGTFVNGRKLESGVELPITKEDKIQLGMVPIRIE